MELVQNLKRKSIILITQSTSTTPNSSVLNFLVVEFSSKKNYI